MHLCVFDLDHTLVRSPLDLAAMAADMQAVLEQQHCPPPPRRERYRVGELIIHCQREIPALEPDLWRIAHEHERQALEAATLEPGARQALTGVRREGWSTALWTNNARQITAAALERFGLLGDLDLVVTRDEMPALKPDPAGWQVICARLGECEAVVVGDSWVDGVAAAAARLPFIAYRADPAMLARWHVTPLVALTDLAALPACLASHWQGASGR